MSQQINLFEVGLVKSKDWFTLPMVAGVYAFAAGVMFYLGTGIEAESAQLQVQRSQAMAQYENIQKKVDELSQRVVPVDNSKLETELKNLKARLDMQSQILAIFQQSISDAASHLVDYMRALTARQQPGLWLTGFKIEPAAQHVTLNGQALQSGDIPLYLDLLSSQPIFEGAQFSGIQFKQVELHKTQPATAAPASVNAVAPVPSSVSEQPTSGKGASEAASTSAAPVAVPAAATTAAQAQEVTLKVYDFEVKGQDLQNRAKRDNAISWDEFVRQTTQSQPAQQPKKE
jgi:hypothetical protein